MGCAIYRIDVTLLARPRQSRTRHSAQSAPAFPDASCPRPRKKTLAQCDPCISGFFLPDNRLPPVGRTQYRPEAACLPRVPLVPSQNPRNTPLDCPLLQLFLQCRHYWVILQILATLPSISSVLLLLRSLARLRWSKSVV